MAIEKLARTCCDGLDDNDPKHAVALICALTVVLIKFRQSSGHGAPPSHILRMCEL